MQSSHDAPRKGLTRRDFFRNTALAGGGMVSMTPLQGESASTATTASFSPVTGPTLAQRAGSLPPLPDLRPALWIWYPSSRCLANTMVLFRREIPLTDKPKRATGWIVGSSRYQLSVNGRRIQFGPAPCDPRFEEADPFDLTEQLQVGGNVIGAQVLYYGHGEGTWPAGKPGFLFYLEIEKQDGTTQRIVSDPAWRVHLARAWRPGQYKRWYLRAFQEEFDARLYPYGWDTADFRINDHWLPAQAIGTDANLPSIAADYSDYVQDVGAVRNGVSLRARTIPLLRENTVPVKRLAEQYRIQWIRPAEEYFECLPDGAFQAEAVQLAKSTSPGGWEVELDGTHAVALTFEFQEQSVGWPFFTIEAPAGTTVELLVHEAHRLGGPPLLNTHFHAWSRFICREGINRFQTFDFESFRWLQLHIRNAQGRVLIRDLGMLRRQFPWPHSPQIQCSDPDLTRVLNASINTLHNSAQDTCVDGMARERQQYSGDGGHQLHGVYYAFGEHRLPARFLRTWSQGMTLDGYFLDCWPAFDRLARIVQRQLGFTQWGPLLDHGVGFNFDCYHYHLHSGNLEPLGETYPRLLRFATYLRTIQNSDGLLRVENIGVPAVWMDHQAYQRQRHKQCAFNLYAAAMLETALPTLARALGDETNARAALAFGKELREATIKTFWHPEREAFVVNLPWLAEEKNPRMCDRSTATAILFGQCPEGKTAPSVKALAELPSEMGESYPCNANWRYWALAKAGRIDIVLKVLRERWAQLPSVLLNNTLQEDWSAQPDSGSQWSHCAVAPLYCTYMNIAGIQPLEAGFRRCEVRPQLGDLESLELTVQTVRGALTFAAKGPRGNRVLTLALPPGCSGELVVPSQEKVAWNPLPESAPGLSRYQIPGSGPTTLRIATI